MDKNYIMLSFLAIKKELSQEMESWLESEHLKAIRDSGCFIKETIKVASNHADAKPLVYLCYRHTFINEKAKNRFKNTYQLKLKQDFLKRYKDVLEEGDVRVYVLISEEIIL